MWSVLVWGGICSSGAVSASLWRYLWLCSSEAVSARLRRSLLVWSGLCSSEELEVEPRRLSVIRALRHTCLTCAVISLVLQRASGDSLVRSSVWYSRELQVTLWCGHQSGTPESFM